MLTNRLGQLLVLAVLSTLVLLTCFSRLSFCQCQVQQQEQHHQKSQQTAFGRGMLAHFMLAPGFFNFNHGSFGCTPISVLEQQHQYVRQMEANPDKWFRTDYRLLLKDVRNKISKYINAREEDVVLVENSSSGVNAILRSLPLQKGDKIIYLNIEYPMVKNTLEYLKKTKGIVLVQVNLTFPIDEKGIVDLVNQTFYRENLAAGLNSNKTREGSVKLGCFSHISSTPAVILPVTQLIQVAHSYGARVMVDGAHALGQIDLNLTALQPDFYMSNVHKWLYGAKGTAFLYVSPSNQHLIAPTVISTGPSDYVDAFEYTGTRDYTAFLAVDASLKFRERFGDKEISSYNHNLAVWAGDYLASLWGTETLTGKNTNMVGSMVNVRLPTKSDEEAIALGNRLFVDYNMNTVVFLFQGQQWMRLSSQIFLERDDFIQLGAIVKKLTSNPKILLPSAI